MYLIKNELTSELTFAHFHVAMYVCLCLCPCPISCQVSNFYLLFIVTRVVLV